MKENNYAEAINQMPAKQLVDLVIWEAIMENTAWTGWTERARLNLVRITQEDVTWALKQKGLIE